MLLASEVSSADALQARIRALCASGRAELVQEVPPDAWRCKTLVVSTQALEGAEKDAGAQTAVLVVLRLEQRLSLPKLKQLLKPQRLKILGLASPREAEDVIGCSMGLVPPVCIEPARRVILDTHLFQAGTSPAAGPRLVLGAADEEMHLAMSPRELLLETEACIAEISDSGPDTALPEFPLRAGRGNVVHVVALVAAVRRLSRQLLFADLLPAGSPKDGERSVWLSPDGSGKLVRLQLLLGRSLAERLGGDGLSAVVKRLRPMQLVYVAGRLQLEEPGEQCGKATPAAPTEVRKIREAQLSNGIVDMAEQIRILEEVHLPSELSGSARQVGVKKELPPTAHAPDSGLPTLPLALPQRAVHVVTDLQGVELLENVLRERLSGSGDVDPHDGMASKESTVFTPLLPVMGVDAEWQPRTSHGLALFQMAFRRSVFLLDMVALTRQDPLRGRVAELIKEALEAEHLYKVGFNLEVDLQRLHAVLPETSCAVNLIDLRDLHAVALPNAPSKPLSLTGMVKEVFGLPLDKTCQVSDWQKRPLTPEQLDYAAQDAHVCVRLFDSLCYNHATVATQVLQPVLRGMVRTWPREKEPAIVRTADRRATEWDSVQQGAQLQLVPKEGKGAGRPTAQRRDFAFQEVAQRHVGHWRFLAKAEGDFRSQALASELRRWGDPDPRIWISGDHTRLDANRFFALDARPAEGTLLFQLGPAEGTLLPQEKSAGSNVNYGVPMVRQLGKNYAPGHIATRQAAGAARVRFSEKSESMMPAAAALASWFWGTYAFSSEDVFGDATAAYRVLTPREELPTQRQIECLRWVVTERGGLDFLVVDAMSLMVPSYRLPEQLRLARVQLCVGLFLFSPAAVQPHEAAERGRGRPRKGTAVVVQGTGKSGQCRQVAVLDDLKAVRKQVEAEMTHYERLNFTGEGPLSWWRGHQGQMPELAQFAQAALGVPGSSAALERLFSKAGLFITRRRPRLKPGTVGVPSSLQTWLHGQQRLEPHAPIPLASDGEGDPERVELQLLKRRWAITVTTEVQSLEISTHPLCRLLDFTVQVAEALQLPDAVRPVLSFQGQRLPCDDTSLRDMDLEAGSCVRVTSTEKLPLVALGTGPETSQRSDFLESSASVGLLDECQDGQLLLYPGDFSMIGSAQTIFPGKARKSSSVMVLPEVLNSQECRDIMARCRLATPTAGPFISSALSNCRPLGFGCAQGDWELAGFNCCFRVTSYGSGGFLKAHRDAPYTPNAHQRSLCTLLIPLCSIGKTRFYDPKEDIDTRGMSLQEELDARGGLLSGFSFEDVDLCSGHALIFGHEVLHEGLSPESSDTKVMLRTDVMVSRKPPPEGLQWTPVERSDQAAALRHFRAALRAELEKRDSTELYERAQSYRFHHPDTEPLASGSVGVQSGEQSRGIGEANGERGAFVEALANQMLEACGADFIMPEIAYLQGPVAAFRLKPSDSLGTSSGSPAASPTGTVGHLRVAALYALHLLGHHAYEPSERQALYTANFDPKTQTVTAVPLRKLLEDVFHSRSCHGAVYNVLAANSTSSEDFEKAVDRTHMALNHAAPSVGIDVLASLKSEAYAKSFRGDLREKARPAYTLPDFTKQVQASYIARADSPQKLARTESQPMAYLQQLLGEKSHLPGLDIVAVASGDDFHLCEDWRVSCYCGGCDKEEPEPQVEVVSRPMNHLVFDFNSHQIQVQEWKEAQETHGFFDPCLLWTELAWCLQSVHPSNPLAAPWSITFHVTDGTMTLTRQGSMVAVFLEKSLLKSVSLSEMRFDDQGFLQWPLMPDALGSRVKVPPESQDALRRFLNSSYDCSKLAEQVSCEEAISLSNKAARLLERGLASWEPQGYIYMKKRKDFGRYCNFDTVEVASWEFGMMRVFHNIPEFSEHSVNTARVKTHARVMTHVEGGWPKEIDYSEAQDTLKYRKRLEKERSSPLLPDSTRSTAGRDPAYISAVRQLTKQTIPCLEMNNTIDLFEIYFQDEEPDHMPEILNLKTIALFKDPSDEARSVTKIGWHPEGPTKLVGSYSNLRFQRMSEDMPMASFIWDISERNVPLMELRATSPLICCQYNQKNPDWLLGGSYSGLINHYDLRKGPSPCMKSSVEVGHYDPVYDVVWLQSKTGTECASVSSDGRLLFWDVRKLNEVSDECVLTDGNKESPKTLGGVSLEWMQEAGPTKFLVGSEHGIILSCTKRPKKQVEIGTWFGSEDRGGYGKHFGPVYSVKRNPFHVKFFLSVGDWCGKMWMEELKGPMLQTPYYPAFISAAAWSPTRAGVFFLARQDGRLDVWDYFYRMNEVALTQQVSDRALTSLNVQSHGRLAAVGDAGGVITLLQLCDGLVEPGPNEKNAIGWMFDRETKREKALDQIKKQGGGPKKDDKEGATGTSIDKTKYQEREKAFFTEPLGGS
ncbi:unnamed protein product [Durusdinium trenchii]|uniref:3'-5' exonuclease domain-containing protein n=1 Tax=Durusdinium trenchii TaxID=1381693 RepID=A0ABP0I2F4_9DINO